MLAASRAPGATPHPPDLLNYGVSGVHGPDARQTGRCDPPRPLHRCARCAAAARGAASARV
eukprot:4893113-Pleurochrysis_carterae.AAC.1